jgi:hypothetical protein
MMADVTAQFAGITDQIAKLEDKIDEIGPAAAEGVARERQQSSERNS